MKTILVIDDERAIAHMLCTALEDEGYQTAQAANGQEGLNRLEAVQPDLVICDVMMPVMDGREFCRNIQEHAAYQSIPVILMSAAARSLSLKGYQYAALLPKPFDLDTVLQTIHRLLSHHA